MDLYRLVQAPNLDQPVMVVALEGWFDAGLGAAGAAGHLVEHGDPQVVATFADDDLLDHRARRPTVRIENGVNKGLMWPTIRLLVRPDDAGREFLLLIGPEPDHFWRGFTSAVVELVTLLGVRLVVGLGAFPAPVPHTRPVKLSSTATTDELAAQVGFIGGQVEIPAGAQAALEEALGGAGIPAAGIWARVPHYLSGMPYPAASAALVEGLAKLTGLQIDASDLHEAARLARDRLDELVSTNEQHAALVRSLEAKIDAEEAEPPLSFDNLPSGDEIAAELERFLRGEAG
ncbi:MAG: proteasome assembly chaperone family protein [Acidimicrobiales bacterium]